ncbi:MAG: transcriptional repressor LexA [Rhodovibrionaceae bacterium]|nr:transcriptional repressor LexA [Rhodovibrionaceae bacterium]
MLTRKQHELLLFIHRHLNTHGVSPSFDEMKDALDLKSKSGIHRLITGLEERGFIRRLPHRARALEVLRLPENLAESATTSATVSGAARASNIIEGDFAPDRTSQTPPAANDSAQLPLYGRIAAGTPIEALRDHNTFVDVPPSMLGQGEHYALEVEGDSMIDVGIHDGDTVIIQRAESADSGTIVVALVDGEEATLKRLRRRGQTIALEPANTEYEVRIFPPDRVQVQGKLIGLLRRY